MTLYRDGGKGRRDNPDMDVTKEHILSAGRELMLAADGALRFCKSYAQQAASPKARLQLVSFFTKAISIADELAKGLIAASGKEAVKKAAAPIFDALGEEMATENPPAKRPAARRAKRAGSGKSPRKRPAAKPSKKRAKKSSRKS